MADRVRRPFTMALEEDELEALVDPAVSELMTGAPEGAGARLERRAEGFLGLASGSGVEVPGWLDHLGTAVDRALERADAGLAAGPPPGRLPDSIPWRHLPWADLHAALARK
jgi:hypothetical protein